MFDLTQLGFQPFFQSQIDDDHYSIGRIATASNGIYKIYSNEGEFISKLSGKFYHLAKEARDFPCVGDWVAFTPIFEEMKGVIHLVLERKSLLSRHAAGEKKEEQLMAANVDTVFLVNALNKDFNLRRMERYLIQVYESGAEPVFILTKKDLCDDVAEKIQAVESIAFGVPIVAINTLEKEAKEALMPFIQEGKTISLIGSSGVGKSTLINQLLERDAQKTQGIREDDAKGRHTTTHRELFVLPSGAVVIDTPGMRELQLWSGEEATSETFKDIESLALQCKFRDCEHNQEPGCAIRNALEVGDLDYERYNSYLKLQREARFLDLKDKYGTNRATRIQSKEFRKKLNS